MILGLDRVLIAIPDLAASTLALEAALGLTAAGGGVRAGSGAASSIIPIGDAFLELIAAQDPRELRAENRGRALAAFLGRGGGLAGFSLVTDSLEAAVEAAWAETVPTAEPRATEFHLFNGQVIHWHSAEVAGDPWGRRMPVLTEYATEAERAVLLPALEPPLGATAIAGVTICTRLVFDAVDAFRRYLGLEPAVVSETRAVVRIGEAEVEFLAPETAGDAWAVGAPADEGLFGVTLEVTDVAQARAYLLGQALPFVEGAPGQLVLTEPSRTANTRFRLKATRE